jgi:Ran GTPase-activating protein (RanGAP) involved in mRNA processing and transport
MKIKMPLLQFWSPYLRRIGAGLAAGRTIILRRTSKRVKEAVDKMRLPAVIRFSRSFSSRRSRNGTATEKLQFVMRQLTVATTRCRITTLELPDCDMKGQDTERLAEVLTQCPSLAHLDLSVNVIGTSGAERLAGVLGQCRVLAHLNIGGNWIGDAGVERLAGVLPAALAHLDLCNNRIGSVGTERLAGVLPQCPALAHLNLWCNQIGASGAESLAGVLPHCAALPRLNLEDNEMESAGTESFAGVLA